MGREWEIKYAAADREVLDRILAELGRPARQISMSSIYYDTAGGELTRRKWTLRLRREGDTSVVTMKTAGDGRVRGEWEYEAPDLDRAAERLCALGAPEALREILRQPVMPVCGAEFVRRAVTLPVDGSVAELALDLGRLFRQDRQAPLCEVELELKQGPEGPVEALARQLADRYGLQEEPLSKFVRASRL